MSNINCLFCRSDHTGHYFNKETREGTFSILRCDSCGSAFVWPRPGNAELASYYESDDYARLTPSDAVDLDSGYYPTASMDAERVISRCRKIACGDKFLDVGAGFGPFSKRAVELGFQATACEPNGNSRDVFEELCGFRPDAAVFDRDYAQDRQGFFDVVLLSQVLEHIGDPSEMVGNIKTALAAKGIASIAVPHFGSALSIYQGQKDMFISPPEHLNFFSKKGLVSIFHHSGFILSHLETVSKINRRKLKQRFPTCGWLVSPCVYLPLKISELFGYGMVINAIFQKVD